ncbi:MAG TPA: methyltransferase domain-containing protein [Gemmatirosa sp.]|nr:methyltransferase domain-containing protein [Gemmatirosa sp.]
MSWNRLRYTLYAPVYDLAVARLPLFRRGRRRSLALAALRPGERALLVAAGTGLDLELLPDGVEVIATDLTPAMVARLALRADALRRAGRDLRVRAEVMDAGRLGLPDASVDCVVLHLALAVVPDPVAAIREAARVLRPGGRVAVFDKFLPDGARPTLVRRVAAAVARVVATDLNRQLGPLLAAAGLREVAREPVGLGGAFVAARADREPLSR